MTGLTPAPHRAGAELAAMAAALAPPADPDEPADLDPSSVDVTLRDALADRLRAGDVPARLVTYADEVRELAAHGCPFHAAVNFLERRELLTATERSAITSAVYDARPGETGEALIPDLDYRDLFAGSPVVIEQIETRSGGRLSTDLLALGALAAGSAALARKVTIDSRDRGWHTWPVLQIAAVADSGRGKGPMTRAMGSTGALQKWERTLCARHAAHVKRAAHDRELRVALRDDLFKREKKAFLAGQADEVARLRDLVVGLDVELAAPLPRTPRFLSLGDGSPEGLEDHAMAAGFLHMTPAEGMVLLRRFAGTDRDKDGLNLPLIGWSCEASGRLLVSRKDEPVPADDIVAISMLLPMQRANLAPDTPDGQRELRTMVERGWVARWIVARPRVMVVAEPEEEEDDDIVLASDCPVQARYDAFLLRLAESASDLDPDRPLAPARPAVARLDDDAARAFRRFQRHYTALGGPGGAMQEWGHCLTAQKLGEMVLRVACVVAAMRVVTFGGEGFTITRDDWDRAQRFVEGYSLPHARAVIERAAGSSFDADAAELARYLAERGPKTVRDLRRGPFKRWGLGAANDRRERFDVALATAEKLSLVRVEKLAANSLKVHALRGAA